MKHEFSFQTRARTVDHLGREQIADCPTAISELWKNAFDAYARNVALDIYDGEEPIATIIDDGHGMSYEEFIHNWLVVGTESKAADEATPVEDRNGLEIRPRQGQKGIGRLSCANLGPILLLVSKRKTSPFVAALVDWRLFENPFLNLSDIQVPVTEFEEKEELFEHISDLVTRLSENISGGTKEPRKDQITDAWYKFDNIHKLEFSDENRDNRHSNALSEEILTSISQFTIETRHIQKWPLWTGDACHGTALFISPINYDLYVELDETIADAAAVASRKLFFETLSSFVDPFIDKANEVGTINFPQFNYVVRAWESNKPRIIVGLEKQFDKRVIDGLEHCIEGTVDSGGVFKGKIRAFGVELPDICVIEPPRDLSIPIRRDIRVGSFEIFIATMEFVRSNSTHSEQEHRRIQDLASQYSGFMMFRDGLRVLPYGRPDNDFFEIESRRSKNAGREFWNHRQMFGRISISRTGNPNLRDKAGREGLLDNRAAKTLKGIVLNILRQSALKYFGSASDMRNELLPEISAENLYKRVAEQRNKLRKRHRKEFRSKLRRFNKDMPTLLNEIEIYVENLEIRDETQITEARTMLEEFRVQLSNFKLPGAPKQLNTLEESYTNYRVTMKKLRDYIKILNDEIENSYKQIQPNNPKELLERQLNRQAAQIHHRIQVLKKKIFELHRSEEQRIKDLVMQRNKVFQAEVMPLFHRFEIGQINFSEISHLMDTIKDQIDDENDEIFVSYIRALESLKDSIDLDHLAMFSIEEVGELRVELDRLTSLAQLGIAVEIVGHELQSYDDIIGAGLKRLPENIRGSSAVKDIELGYEGLTDQLRFLSPLRLAGHKIQRWISGQEIADYTLAFFTSVFAKNRISIFATDKFLNIQVFDQKSRIFPVFINLLNNSIYWLSTSEVKERQIILDIVDSQVVVSDNGPGVDPEDEDSLFKLFFTKKLRGGRGVGLYLCRANLAAGGHTIQYQPSPTKMPLSGANFLISFNGAKFNNE